MKIWNIPNMTASYDENFEATNGWLSNFIKGNNLSLRRKTSVTQKDPDLLIAKDCFVYTAHEKITNEVFISTIWYHSIWWDTCLKQIKTGKILQ